MAGRHTGPRGDSARDGVRLRESFAAINDGEVLPRRGRAAREVSALRCPITDAAFLLWRHRRIFGTAGKLLRCNGGILLLLHRRLGLARETVPVLSEPFCSRT